MAAYEQMSDAIVRHQLWPLTVGTPSVRNRSVGIYLHCYQSASSRKMRDRERCHAAAKRFDTGPGYSELLNTTFALCPAGRSPASYRMNEVRVSH